MRWKNFGIFICLLTLISGYQIADAQENLAQQAYDIFKRYCFRCHEQSAPNAAQLTIQHAELIKTRAVIPRDPNNSELYKRLITDDIAIRMPQKDDKLPPDAIETIKHWIQDGALNWQPEPDTDFITPTEMLKTIEEHVYSLSPYDRAFTRYFTLTHLYNAGESAEALHLYQQALSKLVNSLSWCSEVVNPEPIDAEETIFYIDLRHYEWEHKWDQIEQAYPYSREFASPIYTTLRHQMDCEMPFIRADWFIATASLPPLYHAILDLPGRDTELEARLGVDVAKNLRNAAGVRVWRAGIINSGVALHNRIVERHKSPYGAYWKTYDFASSDGEQNISANPLDFKHDGGEIIFNLPNGLQAYYISDASGVRLDAAPTKIVANQRQGVRDPAVRNGLSCMGCHTKGMRRFTARIRFGIEQNPDPPYDKDQALRLYTKESEMDDLINKDEQRYKEAIEASGGVFGEDPIEQLFEKYEGLLNADYAAAEVGVKTDDFLKKIHEDKRLRDLGLLVIEDSGIKRDTWKSHFSRVISVLDIHIDNVQRLNDEPGAPNLSLEISMPDENLRTAVRKALSLVEGDTITEQKMQGLKSLSLDTAGTSDFINLEGLEHATNLRSLSLRVGAGIKDITPLKGLTALTSLYISANVGGPDIDPLRFSDIHPLQDMTALTSLTLDGIDQISDLTPLRRLTDLTFLRLSANQISDITPLEKMTNLYQLHVESNEISDITPLQKMTKLAILSLHANEITDVSVLENLTSLQELSLAYNPIEDLAPLRRLKQKNPSVSIDIDVNVNLKKPPLAPAITVLPAETVLLSNYPNPFNPETWIPYQLAKPAKVTVFLYATDGKLVRTLDLGYQPAGVYQNKSRAAYWDGKNELGEPVASGVYFYTLTAGEFSATRKMLIRK